MATEKIAPAKDNKEALKAGFLAQWKARFPKAGAALVSVFDYRDRVIAARDDSGEKQAAARVAALDAALPIAEAYSKLPKEPKPLVSYTMLLLALSGRGPAERGALGALVQVSKALTDNITTPKTKQAVRDIVEAHGWSAIVGHCRLSNKPAVSMLFSHKRKVNAKGMADASPRDLIQAASDNVDAFQGKMHSIPQADWSILRDTVVSIAQILSKVRETLDNKHGIGFQALSGATVVRKAKFSKVSDDGKGTGKDGRMAPPSHKTVTPMQTEAQGSLA